MLQIHKPTTLTVLLLLLLLFRLILSIVLDDNKSPSAEDYFDMTELAEDEQVH